jgi:hypothetical protein
LQGLGLPELGFINRTQCADTHRMKAPIYLLAGALLFAASCGDSTGHSGGPERLFVQTSDGAVLTNSRLALSGVSRQTGWFTDRPYRETGQIPTEEFVALWDESENSFADDPPTAEFTCTVDGEVVNYALELTAAYYESLCFVSAGCAIFPILDYDVRVIGDVALPTALTCAADAHLFID